MLTTGKFSIVIKQNRSALCFWSLLDAHYFEFDSMV